MKQKTDSPAGKCERGRGRPRKEIPQVTIDEPLIAEAIAAKAESLGVTPAEYIRRLTAADVSPKAKWIRIELTALEMTLLKDFGKTFTPNPANEASAAHWMLLWMLAHYDEIKPSWDRFVRYHKQEFEGFTQWRVFRDKIESQVDRIKADVSNADCE